MRQLVLTIFLLAILAISSVHPSPLVHEHGDLDVVAGSASMVAADIVAQPAANHHEDEQDLDDSRAAGLAHDHQAPAGINVADLHLAGQIVPTGKRSVPSLVAALASRDTAPPIEPPTA